MNNNFALICLLIEIFESVKKEFSWINYYSWIFLHTVALTNGSNRFLLPEKVYTRSSLRNTRFVVVLEIDFNVRFLEDRSNKTETKSCTTDGQILLNERKDNCIFWIIPNQMISVKKISETILVYNFICYIRYFILKFEWFNSKRFLFVWEVRMKKSSLIYKCINI